MKTRNQIRQEEFDARTKGMSKEEYSAEFNKIISTYNHQDDNTFPVQLLGLCVWLATYLTIPAIVFAALWTMFEIITTGTADRSPFLRWLMEYPIP